MSAFAVVVILTLSTQAFSQRSSNDLDIKDQIYNEVRRNHHPIGYSAARVKLLGHMAIEQENNKYYVTDVYCEAEYASPGLGKVPSNSIINVEHTWPQSKFGGSDKGAQKSDLHHLYPTDSQLNSIRGNNPFGEVVQDTQNTKCPQSHIGYDDSGKRVFEPPQNHKGNVARALFYFSIRYNMPISESEEKVLKQWHTMDPVDAEELVRNDQVESYQGNRNPFIDSPDLVNLINNF